MARPAVVVALPPAESAPVVVRADRRRVRDVRGQDPGRARGPARRARRHRRRDPRRRDRSRRVARVLLAAPRGRAQDPGAHGGVAAARSTGSSPVRRRAPRTSTSPDPYSADVAALARRGHVHPQPDRRRRQRAGPPDGADGARRLDRRRATVVAVFNPKGGVGKTTIATNLAATLQIRRGRNVLLVDADTVTGHVTTSLGIDAVRTRRRQLARRGRGRPDARPSPRSPPRTRRGCGSSR